MPQTEAYHDKSPKNKRNPKPSPIGNNFGFLSFGSPCWARTSDTLINSQVLVPTELRRNIDFGRCKQQPIFPGGRPPSIVGACQLNYRVRDGNGCTLTAKITYLTEICVGTDLSFREVALRVLSARDSLTTVFGMGTGVP